MNNQRENWAELVREIDLATAGDSPRPYIAESWKRCREKGVSQALDKSILLRRIDAADLEHRLRDCSFLVEGASSLLRKFSLSVAAVPHVIYLTDRDGIVLSSTGNDQTMRVYGLLPGFDWSEAAMGTNGAGTALATGRPVAVIGPDHYQLPFRETTCLGAPIYSREGEIIGAVDFSTHVKDAQASQLAQVIQLARSIELCLTQNAEPKRAYG